MNNVMLIGRLTRDPEMRYTAETQMAVTRFSIAVSRPGKDKGADYPNIVVFGKTAENCEKWLKKGRQVAIQGRIQTGSYEKSDGTKVYTTDVIADRVEFLSGETTPETKPEPKQRMEQQDFIPQGYVAIEEDIPF